jgi:hypothetical protein
LKRRKKKLLVALDWVDIKGYQTLMASAALKGRSIPLCWASTKRQTYDGHRSRNAFEESLLLALRSMVPESVKVVILADRGFGRTMLAKFCQDQRFGYLIRVQPNVTARLKGFHGRLLDYPVRRGMAKVLRRVEYRSDQAVTHHVVIRWKKNLPEHRDECWFLMSDQLGTAHQLCSLYARRMTIEQMFRDHKSRRNGWSLRDTQIQKPQRLDRLLLILAIAYLLLCGLGLIAKRICRPGDWCSTSRPHECSIFMIGQTMLERMPGVTVDQVIDAAIALSKEVAPKWG